MKTYSISDYVEYASRGDEFYIGVFAEPGHSQSLLMVTTTDPVAVQFKVLVKEPLFERNATAEYGTVTAIALPPTVARRAMGISVLTESGQHIDVSILNSVTGITQVFPCKARNQLPIASYQYNLFPLSMGGHEEQPLARGMLLLAGCQDTTNIQVFSTHTFSLPVDMNQRINVLPSGEIVTSFSIDQMETVYISTNGDFSGTYVVADKMVTVSLGSECSGTSALNSNCSSRFVQVPPSFAWGRRFFISSRPDSGNGAQYMMQSGLISTTSVTVTCRNETHTTYTLEHILARNTQYVFTIPYKHYCSVSSSEQIQIVQYGSRLNNVGGKSPFQLLIPPIEQYSNNFATIPLYPPNQGTNFIYYLTIFVPMHGTERQRVKIDGQLISEGWNAIYCSDEKPCGYGVDVMLPLQSAVNVTHEDPDTPLGVIVHGIGTISFSSAAGFRLNDLTGEHVHTQVA